MAIEKNTQQGTVGAMSKDGKRFLIQETDAWYSVWDANDQLPSGMGKGAEVSFSYKTKQSGDRVYNNVVGRVGLISAGSQQEPVATVAAVPAGSPSRRDLSICRQVAAKILLPEFMKELDRYTAISLTMEVGEDLARWMACDIDFEGRASDKGEDTTEVESGWADTDNVLDEAV